MPSPNQEDGTQHFSRNGSCVQQMSLNCPDQGSREHKLIQGIECLFTRDTIKKVSHRSRSNLPLAEDATTSVAQRPLLNK